MNGAGLVSPAFSTIAETVYFLLEAGRSRKRKPSLHT